MSDANEIAKHIAKSDLIIVKNRRREHDNLCHASASSCTRWSFSIHRGGRPVGRFILCGHPMGTERRSVTWRERGRFREDYNGNTNVGCHISKYSWSKRRICPRSTQGLRVVQRLVQACSQRLATSRFHSGYGKGQVYPKEGARAYSSQDGITIANAKTYVHLSTTREWVLVQDQATDEITGAHLVADFSPNASMPMRLEAQPDRSVVIGAPPAGYNDLFWLANRGTFTAGSVDGVYVQIDMRTNDPTMKFVADVGADWYLDASVGSGHDLANISGAGQSNWVELTTQWSTLRFYSWSTAQFLANPPPPLAGSLVEAKQTITRRRAHTSSSCRSAS